MAELSLGDKVINCFEKIYDNTSVHVKRGQNLVGVLNLKTGVRQGCPASSTLFNMNLSDWRRRWPKKRKEG